MLQNQVWKSPIQRPWAPDGWRRQRRNGGRGRPLSVFSGPGILAAVMADSHLMCGERREKEAGASVGHPTRQGQRHPRKRHPVPSLLPPLHQSPVGSQAVRLEECGAADLSLAPEQASCAGRFCTKFIIESWRGCGGCRGGTRVCSFLSAPRPALQRAERGDVRAGRAGVAGGVVGGGLRAASLDTVPPARPRQPAEMVRRPGPGVRSQNSDTVEREKSFQS